MLASIINEGHFNFQNSGEPTELVLRLNWWPHNSVSGQSFPNAINHQVSFSSIMQRTSQQHEKMTARGRIDQDAALNEAVLRE